MCIYYLFSRCRTFVDCFIDFPKPLIAAVNGPAIGIAATTLGLCDAVYATESVRKNNIKTTFNN